MIKKNYFNIHKHDRNKLKWHVLYFDLPCLPMWGYFGSEVNDSEDQCLLHCHVIITCLLTILRYLETHNNLLTIRNFQWSLTFLFLSTYNTKLIFACCVPSCNYKSNFNGKWILWRNSNLNWLNTFCHVQNTNQSIGTQTDQSNKRTSDFCVGIFSYSIHASISLNIKTTCKKIDGDLWGCGWDLALGH